MEIGTASAAAGELSRGHVEAGDAGADGYVLGRRHGIAVYENDAVTSLAVRDGGDLVAPRDPDENTDGHS